MKAHLPSGYLHQLMNFSWGQMKTSGHGDNALQATPSVATMAAGFRPPLQAWRGEPHQVVSLGVLQGLRGEGNRIVSLAAQLSPVHQKPQQASKQGRPAALP